MNKRSNLRTSVSLLLVAALAALAFLRGSAQRLVLAGVFTVWAIWATVKYLIPYMKLQRSRYEVRRMQKRSKGKQKETQEPESGNESVPTDAVYTVLLRHVNFRISAYLQSIYPDATWEWREEYPEEVVVNGGTARIQLYGVSDFNFADVTFQQSADIKCSLLKIVPMAEVQTPSGEKEPVPQNQNPIDPQVWYEKQGRTVLETMITDLNSRGHHSLTIRENGEIAIKQADTEITSQAFDFVPERMYWTRLAKVFEREGMAATVTDAGIVLSW